MNGSEMALKQTKKNILKNGGATKGVHRHGE